MKFTGILTSGIFINREQNSQIKKRKRSSLLESLIGPPFNPFKPESSMVNRFTKILNIAIRDNIENNRFEFSLSNGFPFSGELINRHGMPDHLPGFKKRVIGVTVISLNEQEDIINNNVSSNNTFIVAILVDEAFKKNILKRFTFDAHIPSLSNGLIRMISCISGNKLKIRVDHVFDLIFIDVFFRDTNLIDRKIFKVKKYDFGKVLNVPLDSMFGMMSSTFNLTELITGKV